MSLKRHNQRIASVPRSGQFHSIAGFFMVPESYLISTSV
jgi:hypothetical protein